MIIKRIPFSVIEAEQEWAEKEGQGKRKQKLCVQDRQPNLLTVERIDRTSFVLLENYHLFKQYVKADVKETLCIVHPASSSLHQRLLKRIHLELNIKRSTGYDVPKMLIYLLRLGYSVDRIAAEAHSAVTALQPIVLRQRAQIKKQRMKMAAEQRLTIYPFDFMEHAVYIPGMLAWPYQEPDEDEWLEMEEYPTKGS